jgi:hypothetical protein
MLKTTKKFAVELDESDDGANCSIHMVYVHFVDPVNTVVIEEELLLSKKLSTCTVGQEMF